MSTDDEIKLRLEKIEKQQLTDLDTIKRIGQDWVNQVLEHDRKSQERFARIEASLAERITKLEITVYGNGREGLKDRVQRIEINLSSASWAVRLALGAFITAITMAIWNIITR